MRHRQVIQITGLSHGTNPIPVAVRIGQMLTTGSVTGRDPDTGELPEDPEAEIRRAFDNLELVLTRASMGLEHVLRIDVRLRDRQHRELLNAEWTRRFPDPADRPVRHTDGGAPEHLCLQLEATAVDPS